MTKKMINFVWSFSFWSSGQKMQQNRYVSVSVWNGQHETTTDVTLHLLSSSSKYKFLETLTWCCWLLLVLPLSVNSYQLVTHGRGSSVHIQNAHTRAHACDVQLERFRFEAKAFVRLDSALRQLLCTRIWIAVFYSSVCRRVVNTRKARAMLHQRQEMTKKHAKMNWDEDEGRRRRSWKQ